MATPIPGRTTEELLESLDQVLRLYNSNGFYISTVYCDNEFKEIYPNLKDNYDGLTFLDFSQPQAHVPEAERNNRIIKERIRATYHRLPCKSLPKAILQTLVMESARKVNYFPAKHGISRYYSPRQIMHRTTLDYTKHCQYALGQYVQPMTSPIQPIPKNPVPGILFISGLPQMAMKYTPSTLNKSLSVVTSPRNQSPPQ